MSYFYSNQQPVTDGDRNIHNHEIVDQTNVWSLDYQQQLLEDQYRQDIQQQEQRGHEQVFIQALDTQEKQDELFRQQLRAELEATKDRIAQDFREELHVLRERQKQQFQDQITQYETHLGRLQKRLIELEGERDDAHNEAGQNAVINVQLRHNINVLEDEAANLRTKCIQLQSENMGLNSQLNTLRQQQQSWEMEKKQWEDMVEEYEFLKARALSDQEIGESGFSDHQNEPITTKEFDQQVTPHFSRVASPVNRMDTTSMGKQTTDKLIRSDSSRSGSYASVNLNLPEENGEQFDAVRSNSNFLNQFGGAPQTVIQSRRKVRTPPAFRPGGPYSSWQWYLQFEMLITYNSWDQHEALMEFMMAMQGSAAQWWFTLGKEHKGTYATAIDAFLKFYGGQSEDKLEGISLMDTMKQGKEKMIDFGPRLKTAISKVTSDKDLQLYYFYKAVNKEVGNAVRQKEPTTLDDAVDYAVRQERSAQNSGLGFVRNMPGSDGFQHYGFQPIAKTGSDLGGPEPMEGVEAGNIAVQFSSQKKGRERQERKQEDGGKQLFKGKCLACGKPGHMLKACRIFTAFKEAKHHKVRNNVQQVKEVSQHASNETNTMLQDDIVDITNNLFDKLYRQNSQSVGSWDKETWERFMPKVVGTTANDPMKDPRSFVVKGKLGVENRANGSCYNILVDTGAMISTITKAVVDELQLPIWEAPPIFITYGNTSQGTSNTAVITSCQIGKVTHPAFPIRVVPRQNIDIILGNDWLIFCQLLPDPTTKQLLKRQGSKVVVVASAIASTGVRNDENQIPQEIGDFLELFPNLTSNSPVQTITNAPVEHHIDTGDAQPVVRRGRRLSEKENDVVDKEVEEMLSRGVIRPSNSPWCSPPVIVPKPNGDIRFCSNFRGLNSVTKKDKYPIPNMSSLIDRLVGSSWFSIIDLKSAYWQIPIRETDKQKTAFITRQGLWEYNVLAFGLCNSPATFARFMETILRGVMRFTVVYLDDILCFGKSREENLQQVMEVLRILNHWNLKISIGKSKFLRTKVEFLGFVVTATGVRSNPARVLPLLKWKAPTHVKELQSFLGICTFYHKFIANIAHLAAPLYKLLKKDQPWEWSGRTDSAFKMLKEKLIKLPELAYPDPNQPYELHCDSSDFALGAVLVQNGRPVAYASRKLNAAERNYSTTERECLAVAWALKYMHCYVHGASLSVYTDHAALRSLLSVKEPKGRIARWIMDIWSYDFEIFHKKGKLNADADALSRIEIDNAENITHINTQDDMISTYLKAQQEDVEIQTLLRQQSSTVQIASNGLVIYVKKSPNVVVIPKSLRSSCRSLKFIHIKCVTEYTYIK